MDVFLTSFLSNFFQKLRFPCTVTKYDGSKNQVLLTYEDEDEKWHKVDLDISKIKNTTILPSYEGTFDDKATRFKVLAVPKDGEGAIFKFGDDSDWDVEDGVHFPPIPPKMLDSRMPQLIHNTKVSKRFLYDLVLIFYDQFSEFAEPLFPFSCLKFGYARIANSKGR